MNINEYVEVDLTPNGRQVYCDHLWALKIEPPKHLPNPVKLQLWDLMGIFGPECYMGNTKWPLFERNEVRRIA